jgi:hypothetical protein
MSLRENYPRPNKQVLTLTPNKTMGGHDISGLVPTTSTARSDTRTANVLVR